MKMSPSAIESGNTQHASKILLPEPQVSTRYNGFLYIPYIPKLSLIKYWRTRPYKRHDLSKYSLVDSTLEAMWLPNKLLNYVAMAALNTETVLIIQRKINLLYHRCLLFFFGVVIVLTQSLFVFFFELQNLYESQSIKVEKENLQKHKIKKKTLISRLYADPQQY